MRAEIIAEGLFLGEISRCWETEEEEEAETRKMDGEKKTAHKRLLLLCRRQCPSHGSIFWELPKLHFQLHRKHFEGNLYFLKCTTNIPTLRIIGVWLKENKTVSRVIPTSCRGVVT